jgi:hypothetical protein
MAPSFRNPYAQRPPGVGRERGGPATCRTVEEVARSSSSSRDPASLVLDAVIGGLIRILFAVCILALFIFTYLNDPSLLVSRS